MKNKLVTFFILFFCGVGFGAAGMVLPPTGIIHSSVLILVGQIFILCASIYGYEIHFDINKGKFDAGHKKENEEDDEDQD